MKTSDRYVVEDGIPTIRQINPHTGEPMGTEKEIDAAINEFIRLREAYWADKPAEARVRLYQSTSPMDTPDIGDQEQS